MKPWTLAVLLALPLAASADDLRTLGGKVLTGQTTSITELEIKINTGTMDVATPLSSVIALDLRPVKGIMAGTKHVSVRLVDDTILNCQGVAFAGKDVELILLSGARFKLPLAYVTWFVRDGHDAELMKKWSRLLKDKLKADRLVILKDGELNPLDGTLGAVDEKNQSIDFTREGDETKIQAKLEKVHGLVFFRPDALGKEPLCRVYDADGNALTAAKLTYADKAFQITTTFGATVKLDETAVARIDFNMGKLTFLSDLEPARVIEKSRLGLIEPYRKDTNLDGQPIQLDQAYAKGLSMHAYTEVEYALAGKFKEFKAVLGVDARIGASSAAKVAIYCDGKVKFNEVVTLKTRPIAIDVKDVTTLKIVVSSPDFFGLGDHATLADAQVRK